MTNALAVVAIVAGFLVAFPLFWAGVVCLIAYLGGWTRLAGEFPGEAAFEGERFSWRSGTLGIFGNYRNVLDVAVSARGIWLRPIVFFRPGHRPLMIPWTAVTRVSSHQAFLAVQTVIELRLAQDRTRSISLYGNDLATSIARHAPAHLKSSIR